MVKMFFYNFQLYIYIQQQIQKTNTLTDVWCEEEKHFQFSDMKNS